jgi:hypothetical protein
MQEIAAKLVLTQEDVAYIWHGGTLAVKIDGAEAKVSVDIACSQSSDSKRQSVRIKRIQAKRQAE